MAEDVRLKMSEWETMKENIQTKVDTINSTLDEFTEILNDLATNGFLEGGAHDPILSFKNNVGEIKDCLAYIYSNITKVMDDYATEVENADHSSLQQ